MKKHFEANKKVVLDALKSFGVECVVLSYSGSGDSGQIDNVEFIGGEFDDKEDGPSVTLLRSTSRYIGKEIGWEEITAETRMPLKEAVETLAYDMLDQHVGGWENNDGGQGEVKLMVHEDKVRLHHEQNVIHVENETYEG